MPPAARDYLAFIAEETGVPVALVSVGSRREDTVKVDPAKAAAAGVDATTVGQFIGLVLRGMPIGNVVTDDTGNGVDSDPDRDGNPPDDSFSVTQVNGITQGNRNTLLGRDDSVVGMKTGWTESAGFCLVTSAKRGDMRLISVVLGTESATARANESQALLNYGFRFFETRQVWEQGAVIANQRVWKGVEPTVDLVVREPVFATVPSGSLAKIETIIDTPEQLMAPIDENSPIGSVKAEIDGKTVAEATLYSAKSVPEGSFFQTTWDEILLFFE